MSVIGIIVLYKLSRKRGILIETRVLCPRTRANKGRRRFQAAATYISRWTHEATDTVHQNATNLLNIQH